MKSIFAKLNELNIPELTKIAKDIKMVKVAQFVGVQGYAIRNSRCWGNCYRQKRVTEPKLSAQKIWEKCHEEYLESINNDNSGWEKYAEEIEGIKKFASKNVNLSNKLINENKKIFNNYFQNNLETGLPIGFAIKLANTQMEQHYNENLFAEIDKLEKFAEKSDPKTKAIINGLANDLKKNAFWNELGTGLKNVGTGIAKGLGNLAKYLGTESYKYLNQIKEVKKVLDTFNTINLTEIDKELRYLSKFLNDSKNNPTNISKVSQQISNITSILEKNFTKAQAVLSSGIQSFGNLGKVLSIFSKTQSNLNNIGENFTLLHQYMNQNLGNAIQTMLAKPDENTINTVQNVLNHISTEINKMGNLIKSQITPTLGPVVSQLEADIATEKATQGKEQKTQTEDFNTQISTVLKDNDKKTQFLDLINKILTPKGFTLTAKNKVRTIFSAKKIFSANDTFETTKKQIINQPTQNVQNPVTQKPIDINTLAQQTANELLKNNQNVWGLLSKMNIKRVKDQKNELLDTMKKIYNDPKLFETLSRKYDELRTKKVDPKEIALRLEKEFKNSLVKYINNKIELSRTDKTQPENKKKYNTLIKTISENGLYDILRHSKDLKQLLVELTDPKKIEESTHEKLMTPDKKQEEEKNRILKEYDAAFTNVPTTDIEKIKFYKNLRAKFIDSIPFGFKEAKNELKNDLLKYFKLNKITEVNDPKSFMALNKMFG